MSETRAKRTTIEISVFSRSCIPPHQRIQALAWIIPDQSGLAVTRWHGGRYRYSVTHIASGRRLTNSLSKENALAAMQEFYALGAPWHLKMKHVKRVLNIEAAQAIANKYTDMQHGVKTTA